MFFFSIKIGRLVFTHKWLIKFAVLFSAILAIRTFRTSFASSGLSTIINSALYSVISGGTFLAQLFKQNTVFWFWFRQSFRRSFWIIYSLRICSLFFVYFKSLFLLNFEISRLCFFKLLFSCRKTFSSCMNVIKTVSYNRHRYFILYLLNLGYRFKIHFLCKLSYLHQHFLNDFYITIPKVRKSKHVDLLAHAITILHKIFSF